MTPTANGNMSFDIKIVGAGVAGLAAGLALARKGHSVTIYEANQQLSEFGAGLQLFANATRIIYEWGLQDEFLKVVNAPSTNTFRRYSDNTIIGEIPCNPVSEWEYVGTICVASYICCITMRSSHQSCSQSRYVRVELEQAD